ncbi:MAG: thioredoxin domain-containing protein [Thermogutta sp.]
MPNRLINEKSPYLRQHAENPVDWYPWSEEAFRRAKELDRPIFLSIGYSACHWCHVMEKESFADPEVAAVLNQYFVPIKVDREEHPAVDAQYMEAVQIITGRGGWPLSLFLTPDLQPFFGGTYWPRNARLGLPGFLDILRAVAEAWRTRRDQIAAEADKVTVLLNDISNTLPGRSASPDHWVLEKAEDVLAEEFDHRWGGFGVAPKFPHPSVIRYLLTRSAVSGSQTALAMALRTLDGMADGGIYDHLGGGFHRYATDGMWLVPHFEKMLYDNALLARAYLDAYRLTRRDRYAQVVRETIDYLCREMQHPEGAFFASQDADSEGDEGKFYLWTSAELQDVLGAAADRFAAYYGMTAGGAFQGKNLPNRIQSAARWMELTPDERTELEQEMAELRRRLREARDRRTPPARDDKIILAWNAFAADAMLMAGRAFDSAEYLAAGTATLDFLLTHLRDENGAFYHSWCQGEHGGPAILEDQAALAVALITGYEMIGREEWLEIAVALAEDIRTRFYDSNTGVFFMTPQDYPHLLCRRLDYFDSPTPSGTALTAEAMLRLGSILSQPTYIEAAEASLRALAGWMRKSPISVGHALYLRQTMLSPWKTWVFVLPQANDLPLEKRSMLPPLSNWLATIAGTFDPFLTVSIVQNTTGAKEKEESMAAKILAGRTALNGKVSLYVCEGESCSPPLVGDDAIEDYLRKRLTGDQDVDPNGRTPG